MKLDFREICKTIFLSIASVNLGISSEMPFFGIVFALMFVYLFIRDTLTRGDLKKKPAYKKIIAYGAIIPFALWWVMTPSVNNGISPYIVFIPAWYLLLLCWLQKRSLGNGGFEVFVAFNGIAVLLLGLFHGSRPCAVAAAVGLWLAIRAYSRPKTAWYKHFYFVMLFVFLGASAFGGWHYWKYNHSYSEKWGRDYFEKNRVMGFNPVVTLGSFGNNFDSRYNSQVILRIWDKETPEYLRAAVYEKYVGGVWKLPAQPTQKLYPAYYQVDYPVFEVADSSTRKGNVKEVWVQSSIDNFGFMFASYNAVGVSAKNLDSIDYFAARVFDGRSENRSDWYYYENVDPALSAQFFPSPNFTAVDSGFLQVGVKYQGFMDSVAVVMGVDSATVAVPNALVRIRDYFKNNFEYSLQIPGIEQRGGFVKNTKGVDPLRVFWKEKKGYCEYFATMAVLLLRREGIPARYVTGFAHPERREDRSYVIFRRYHAHAWVEVYDGEKWIYFDPTPKVASSNFTSPSWIQIKWESIQGSLQKAFHVLRDGSWRKIVDSWQSVSQAVLENEYVYIMLGFALFVFVGFRIKNNLKKSETPSKKSPEKESLIKQLEIAENKLTRLGWNRQKGETVSAFVCRIENGGIENSAKKAETIRNQLNVLKAYEKARWVK